MVGRWTGRMGEGLAIGFEGIARGEIVGTEMHRLAGAVEGFSFINNDFDYQLSTEKLFHLNDTLRERYIPLIYIKETRIDKDEALKKALSIINKKCR